MHPDNYLFLLDHLHRQKCPPQESLARSYSFLSASFTLRRLFFLICVSAARDSRRLSAIFREVIMFLQGVEMGHILMIDRYIFSKYPELLRIRSLRDNMESMNTAWAYLASLEPGERYFAKILYTKDETAALNRNNFTLLSPICTKRQGLTSLLEKYWRNFQGKQWYYLPLYITASCVLVTSHSNGNMPRWSWQPNHVNLHNTLSI